MSRKSFAGVGAFLGTWATVHLFYAFTYLDWSPFYEWTNFSRGMCLVISIYNGGTAFIFTSGKPRK